VGVVRTGIYSRHTTNNSSALYKAIGTRLYYVEAPEKPIYPYCVFHIFDETHEWTFDLEFENISVQFNYFDITADACDTGIDAIKALYDYCILSITGYTTLRMEREMVLPSWKIEPDNIWSGAVRYNLLIQDT